MPLARVSATPDGDPGVYAGEGDTVEELLKDHPEPGRLGAVERPTSSDPADWLSRRVNPRPAAEALRASGWKPGASVGRLVPAAHLGRRPVTMQCTELGSDGRQGFASPKGP